MADVPFRKEIPRLRYPEELSKESFERDFAAKSEPATWICKDFCWASFVFYTFIYLNGILVTMKSSLEGILFHLFQPSKKQIKVSM